MSEYYSSSQEFMDDNGYMIDGAWYPRVTKIVGIKAKPALYRFYSEMGSYNAGKAVSEKSAEEGTMIHEAAEAILLGQKPDVSLSILPAINAFRDFLDSKEIHTIPEYVERRIFHPDHRYAGTIDAMAHIDGKFGVLDIKTSQAIYRDYNLQTSAYIEALKDQFADLSTRWILRIDQGQECLSCGASRRVKGGREKVKSHRMSQPCPPEYHNWSDTKGIIEIQEFPFWQGDFKAFLGAKNLWEWENEFWLRKINYI